MKSAESMNYDPRNPSSCSVGEDKRERYEVSRLIKGMTMTVKERYEIDSLVTYPIYL